MQEENFLDLLLRVDRHLMLMIIEAWHQLIKIKLEIENHSHQIVKGVDKWFIKILR